MDVSNTMLIYSQQSKTKKIEMELILRAEVLSLLDSKCYRELQRIKAFLLGEDIKEITGVKTTKRIIEFKEQEITTYLQRIKEIASKDDPYYAESFKEVK